MPPLLKYVRARAHVKQDQGAASEMTGRTPPRLKLMPTPRHSFRRFYVVLCLVQRCGGMSEFVSLLTGSAVIGLIAFAAIVVVVGVILWWNRKID